VGVDVDREAIQWARRHLDFADFHAIATNPPLPFENGSLDIVYSFSVFSHLPESRATAWLTELARVTKSGALLVFTVMGRRCVDAYLEGREGERPRSDELRAELDRLEESGFLFFPYETLRTAEKSTKTYYETLDLDQYGSTFILESFIRDEWLDAFELRSFRAAPDGWQDYVVLQRR